MFYSIDYGMTHFVVLNGETDFYNAPGGIGSGFTGKIEDQYGQGPFVEPAVPNKYLTWLEADLARVNRSVTPWIVAIHHRPWYCSQVGRQQSAQVVFEPLFLKYGVDLVASGHVHNYERMTPIQYGGIPDPAGYYNPSSPVCNTHMCSSHAMPYLIIYETVWDELEEGTLCLTLSVCSHDMIQLLTCTY
jgi:hypothetical protein